jgi:23S rRNA pseudouridine2605 synthase
MPERLQKYLARHGLGSRREIERWIADGRVTVNLKPAQIGAQYREGDRIAIDGKEVTARLQVETVPQVLMVHKPQGQAIDRDGQREIDSETTEAVVDKLPTIRGSRWVPINPMHPGDSGLVLFTNDGKLGFALTRRKRWIPCVYMVRVLAPGHELAPADIPTFVDFDDERIEFSKVEPLSGEGANVWFRVELPRADRRAAVRALFESRNLKVSRMTQISFGAIQLPRDLPRSRHRALSQAQISALYELAELAPPNFEVAAATVKRRPARRPPPDRRTPKRGTKRR